MPLFCKGKNKTVFNPRDGAAFKLRCVDHRLLTINKDGNLSLRTKKGKKKAVWQTFVTESTGQDGFYRLVHPPTNSYIFAKKHKIYGKIIKPGKEQKYARRADHVFKLSPIEGGTWALQSARNSNFLGVISSKLRLSDMVTMCAESWEILPADAAAVDPTKVDKRGKPVKQKVDPRAVKGNKKGNNKGRHAKAPAMQQPMMMPQGGMMMPQQQQMPMMQQPMQPMMMPQQQMPMMMPMMMQQPMMQPMMMGQAPLSARRGKGKGRRR
ncbi:hypothetical protein J8273_0486 [Carpediemonas membranifera]|uniref:Uncharacterized protein n=1 Tax=Carpediemonas membranifera TaxID=201153 RepID=A0A8J6B8C4_9EUKA|nr:hypothetical protein J8273_0486 [Carpediemonas membranifera]|eukprot:KAG9395264.1 hypothetical protein J8273_0486 [Carpediemonas membranifera]